MKAALSLSLFLTRPPVPPREILLVMRPSSPFYLLPHGLKLIMPCNERPLSPSVRPVVPSFRALSGRLKFTVRRHNFYIDALPSPPMHVGPWVFPTVQGYLAHKKQPPPPRTTTGP